MFYSLAFNDRLPLPWSPARHHSHGALLQQVHSSLLQPASATFIRATANELSLVFILTVIFPKTHAT
jgi:hypothetical protein